jgi:hypothetical protein
MMSLATLDNARIDSKLATFLLVAVFSFAFGIFISLTLVEHAIPMAQQPCTTAPCSRLILMSNGAPSAPSDGPGVCNLTAPSAFENRRADLL